MVEARTRRGTIESGLSDSALNIRYIQFGFSVVLESFGTRRDLQPIAENKAHTS